MVISYGTNDTVSIKAKNETITVGDGVTIGSYRIASAGEYDVAGIQCEATFLPKALVYFIRTEDLTVTILTDVDTAVSKLDDASKTDVLIIELRSDANLDEVKSILKMVEPSYLVLTGAGNTGEAIAKLGLPVLESSQLKLTRTSLPLEGTSILPK